MPISTVRNKIIRNSYKVREIEIEQSRKIQLKIHFSTKIKMNKNFSNIYATRIEAEAKSKTLKNQFVLTLYLKVFIMVLFLAF